MSAFGTLSWVSWSGFFLMFIFAFISGYLFYNINTSDYEKGCSTASQTTKEKLYTSWQYSAGILGLTIGLLVIFLILGILFSVLSFRSKTPEQLATIQKGFQSLN